MVQRELAHSGPFFYFFIGRQPDSEMQRSGNRAAWLIALHNLQAIFLLLNCPLTFVLFRI